MNIKPEDVWHVVPTNDTKPHKQFTKKYKDILKEVIECRCECKPEIKYLNNSVIIIHNSFDGREHFEYPSKYRDN